MEIEVLRVKQKQAVEDLTLGVFYPKCRKNHPLKEFPLDKGISVSVVRAEP